MEMHQVRYFLALCETLNFTRAAQRCNVAQPSLTRAIKNLEEELGGPLFRRERNRTHLTDLGRLVRPHIETVARASESVRTEADRFLAPDHETLRLGMMSTIGPGQMIGFLGTLRDELPTLDVEIEEAPGRALTEMLMDGRLDLALIGLPDLPERLRAIPLYAERYSIAFAKGHPFEDLDAVPCAALDGEPYLQRAHCEFAEFFQATGAERTWKTNLRYTSEREDWVQALVLAGHGCSVMPELLPTVPGILTRPMTEPAVTRTIALVNVAGRELTPSMRAVMRLASTYPWPGGRT